MIQPLPAWQDPELAPFLEKLEQLFAKMDDAYDTAAKENGFVCNGCDESCCKTLFYHHTFLEFFYVAQGLHKLDAAARNEIFQRAGRYVMAQSDAAVNRNFRKMCPLNREGRCQLYAYRPMICRLHGIPYTLSNREGPGCDPFYQSTVKIAPHLDRTALYRELALLEKKLRDHLRDRSKLKLTIAEMIVALKEEWYDENP